jgi:holin-like protein
VLQSITILLLFQLAGEVISQVLRLPIPGPVVGMALLFAALTSPRMQSERLRHTAQNVLQHLSLLFVPAGVGVMLHVERVAAEWLPITVALVLSTVLAVMVTALTTRLLARLLGDGGGA